MKKYNVFVKSTIFLFILILLMPALISPVIAQGNTTGINISELLKSEEPGVIDSIANFLFTMYEYLKKGIVSILEQTVFKANPQLADYYAEVAAFLASLTAIFIILEVLSVPKKVVKILLILGWILFLCSIAMRTFLK
ncbi:MAG: hypothetical protein IMZ42_04765 [Candidatus Atribacteria bacterium]|nr:hypothetical protein [Candidatus Atribacteria bacterium]MBE3093140.1 hypothetical protein [Chloroflexota bacterium]MBE3126720.1 hypothetical protein [Candidatus Atribacteria bacterium]